MQPNVSSLVLVHAARWIAHGHVEICGRPGPARIAFARAGDSACRRPVDARACRIYGASAAGRPAWAGEPTNERSTKARQGKPVQGRPSPIRFGRRSNLGLPGPGNHLPRRVQRGVAPHCPDSAHTRPCDAACSALPCAIACLRAPPRPARDPNPTCVRAGRPAAIQPARLVVGGYLAVVERSSSSRACTAPRGHTRTYLLAGSDRSPAGLLAARDGMALFIWPWFCELGSILPQFTSCESQTHDD